MHFKLIMTFTTEDNTQKILEASREAGATGATVISSARGEGLETHKTFFGLDLETPTEVIISLVEEHLARNILETIDKIAQFDKKPGIGMAILIDVEDAVGVLKQTQSLKENIKEII
jgi:nitrogen regulatory protein PII